MYPYLFGVPIFQIIEGAEAGAVIRDCAQFLDRMHLSQ